ncbi:flagellar hook-length control protein FliK, partial [Angustibacter peucedani]
LDAAARPDASAAPAAPAAAVAAGNATAATVPAPVAATATTPATTSSATPPVPVQLVTAQLGPRALAAAVAATTSGLHTISVQLRPAQLGSVQVVATMGEGGLTLHLHAATDATREVLRAALADLRTDLANGGVTDVAQLEVSDRAPDQQPAPHHQDDAPGRRQAGPVRTVEPTPWRPERDVAPVVRPPGPGRRLDLTV